MGPWMIWPPASLTPSELTGNYFDIINNVNHGFLRASDGTFTTFNVPGSRNTQPLAINPAGEITVSGSS
jgi:hypothetical protein